jgi:hypothetical protein
VRVGVVSVEAVLTVPVTERPVSAPAYDGRHTKMPTARTIRVTCLLRLLAALPATQSPLVRPAAGTLPNFHTLLQVRLGRAMFAPGKTRASPKWGTASTSL